MFLTNVAEKVITLFLSSIFFFTKPLHFVE